MKSRIFLTQGYPVMFQQILYHDISLTPPSHSHPYIQLSHIFPHLANFLGESILVETNSVLLKKKVTKKTNYLRFLIIIKDNQWANFVLNESLKIWNRTKFYNNNHLYLNCKIPSVTQNYTKSSILAKSSI